MSRKIYNEVVIDMNPESSGYGETLYEDSFQDDGPIALCGEYVQYDSLGNAYKVIWDSAWRDSEKKAGSYTYYINDVEVIGSYSGWEKNKSQLRLWVDDWASGKGDIASVSAAPGGDGKSYDTIDEAYAASSGLDWASGDGEMPTFDEIYAAQGQDPEMFGGSPFIYTGNGTMQPSKSYTGTPKEMDLLKSYTMNRMGLTEAQYDTIRPLTMEPIDELNRKFQTDVGDFSNALRDTNVSLTGAIGEIQSTGGFAGESGAITQPLEYQKDLAESGAITAYGALSGGRLGDISTYKREAKDSWYDEAWDASTR